MLVIRQEQFAALRRAQIARFDFEAYEHVQLYFPQRCEELGNQAAMQMVRDGLKRARGYGLESERDLLRYLNLLFHFGDGFELSPANAWALTLLESARPASVRMDLLMDEAFRRLYPLDPGPVQEVVLETDEFDGIVWGDSSVGADYVATSIKPEIDYFPQRPELGSLPTEPPDPLDIDEEDLPDEESEWDEPEAVDGR